MWTIAEVHHPAGGQLLQHDHAAMTVEPLDGRRIEDVVGGQRIAFDAPVPDAVHVFGYPRERTNAPDRPYGGQHLVMSTGPTVEGPFDRVGTRSDMSRGVSGGPVFADFDPATGTGTQIAVVSGHACEEHDDDGCTRESLETSGVRFGAEARRVH